MKHALQVIPEAGTSFIDPERRELMPAFVEALSSWVKSSVVSDSGL